MSNESLHNFVNPLELQDTASGLSITDNVSEYSRPQLAAMARGITYGPDTHDPEAIEFLDELFTEALLGERASQATYRYSELRWKDDIQEETPVSNYSRDDHDLGSRIANVSNFDPEPTIVKQSRLGQAKAWWESAKPEIKQEFAQSASALRGMAEFMKYDALMLSEDETVKDLMVSIPPFLAETIAKGSRVTAQAYKNIGIGIADSTAEAIGNHPDIVRNIPRASVPALAAVVLVSGVVTRQDTKQQYTELDNTEQASGDLPLVRTAHYTEITVPELAVGQNPGQSIHDASVASGIPAEEIKIEGSTMTLPVGVDESVATLAVVGALAPDAKAAETTTTQAPPTSEVTPTVSPEVQAMNDAIAEIRPGQNNNLDTLVEAVKRWDAAFAPNDPNRPAGMPAGYVKMPLLNEAEGLTVLFTVAERTADNERYTSPHMVATLLADAKLYQDVIQAEFPELQGDMLRIRDQNSPAHRTHNDGRHADISGAFGFDVTQYATGAFSDYQFSERFNEEFTKRMAEEMARLYAGGQPVIDKILSSGNTMVPEINQRVGRRLMVDFDHHKDHFHIQLRKDLALPQWRVRAPELPWSVDQDLRIAGMAQNITAEQHASQHGDFEAWVAKQDTSGNVAPEEPVPSQPEQVVSGETEPLSPAAEELINKLDLPEGHKNFLRQMLPSITTVYRAGARINPAVVLAQTSLETGFGSDRLSPATNNFFGMKAGAKWAGSVFNIDTREEYVAGDVTTVVDGFRMYSTPADSVADYANLIQTRPHYADAASNYKSIEGYTNGLFNDVDGQGNIVRAQGEPGVLSYGTDRGYEEKVFSAIGKYGYEALVDAQLEQASTATPTEVTTTTTQPEQVATITEDTATTALKIEDELEQEGHQGTWISREGALHVYEPWFKGDEAGLQAWVDSLPVNEDDKVEVSIYNTPDMARGEN